LIYQLFANQPNILNALCLVDDNDLIIGHKHFQIGSACIFQSLPNSSIIAIEPEYIPLATKKSLQQGSFAHLSRPGKDDGLALFSQISDDFS